MIERIINRYTLILFAMFLLHVITMTVDGVLSSFDFIFVIFVITLNKADEDNYIFMAFLFGLFTDFARDGFYGPGVAVFLIFYLIMFRSDVIMDMTKPHYRLLLFFSMSFFYCIVNLMITSYTLDSALYIAFVRTVINLIVIFAFTSLFKGFYRAVKNH